MYAVAKPMKVEMAATERPTMMLKRKARGTGASFQIASYQTVEKFSMGRTGKRPSLKEKMKLITIGTNTKPSATNT